jgi:hypothetical protein
MTTEIDTRAAWDAIAPGYDQFVTPTHSELGLEGLRHAKLSAGVRFLDVGWLWRPQHSRGAARRAGSSNRSVRRHA